MMDGNQTPNTDGIQTLGSTGQGERFHGAAGDCDQCGYGDDPYNGTCVRCGSEILYTARRVEGPIGNAVGNLHGDRSDTLANPLSTIVQDGGSQHGEGAGSLTSEEAKGVQPRPGLIKLFPSHGVVFQFIEACATYGMYDDGVIFYEHPVVKVNMGRAGLKVGQQCRRITFDLMSSPPCMRVHVQPMESYVYQLSIKCPELGDLS